MRRFCLGISARYFFEKLSVIDSNANTRREVGGGRWSKYQVMRKFVCQERRSRSVFTGDGQKYRLKIPAGRSVDRMGLTEDSDVKTEVTTLAEIDRKKIDIFWRVDCLAALWIHRAL